MSAPVQEVENPQYYMVNDFVREARRNDRISKEYPDPDNVDGISDIEKVLSSLNMQMPNRVYFADDGTIMRVLFFSEKNNPYQARLELLDLEEPNPRILGTETFSVAKLGQVKPEIQAWRRRFDMTGDLLSNPSAALQSLDKPKEIVHVGTATNTLVYCRYYQSAVGGPRFIDLGVGPDYKSNDEVLLPTSIPVFMRQHIAPFPTPTP